MKCKRTESLGLGPNPTFIIMYKQVYSHISDKEYSYQVKLSWEYSDDSGSNELTTHVWSQGLESLEPTQKPSCCRNLLVI